MRDKARRRAPGEEHPGSRVVRIAFGVFGIAVALLSSMFVAIAVTDLVTGGDPKTERSTLVGLVVLFTGGLFWGLNLARGSFGWQLPRPRLPRRTARDKPQEVLSYATSGNGRVTVVEVAGRCQLSIEEAERILNDYAAREVADVLMADDGTVVYDFNILSHKEKARAREIG